MARIVGTYKILPEDPEIDLQKLKEKIEKALPEDMKITATPMIIRPPIKIVEVFNACIISSAPKIRLYIIHIITPPIRSNNPIMVPLFISIHLYTA